MPILVRIALRNLLEHKAKSFIIGGLLALGVVILVVGNSFMDTAAAGIRKTFTENYTADVFVHAETTDPVSLFGVQSVGGREETPAIPEYERVRAILEEADGVVGVASQVTGFALAAPRDSEKTGFALMFGVMPDEYSRVFENAVVVEGRMLEPGEEGILLTKRQVERMAEHLEVDFKVGDDVVLTGIGTSGFKIRAVPLVGLIEYKADTEATEFISYVDADTLRILMGLTLGTDADVVLAPEQTELLASTSDDDLFGAPETVEAAASAAPAATEPAPEAGSAPAAQVTLVDSGAWHFLLARLEHPGQAAKVVKALNARFAAEGLPVVAEGWKAAAGPFAQSVDVVRIVFNIAIVIVAIVAVIIMTNTLVISVIERTGEIGTMRALGAQKGFVRKMFLVETLVIAAVFGLAGTALAFGALGILSAMDIEASNAFLEILFAGKVLRPAVNPMSVLWSLVMVTAVSVVAHVYPVQLALRIQPVRAMQAE
ncbi:MAG: ABC transporter permease [Spirochaetia bacterium]|nr:ABC transporter permease [Spirochaetia bacterium]